jgi:hypothetical protein
LKRRDLERRLARVELNAYAISCADRQAARHRQSLRTQVNLHQLIRERLQLMRIDPALAVSLQRSDRAAAELEAIPDTPELKAADEAIVRRESSNRDGGACEFGSEITKMAEQYRSGQHRLDLSNASPAELLAFCVAVEAEAWG